MGIFRWCALDAGSRCVLTTVPGANSWKHASVQSGIQPREIAITGFAGHRIVPPPLGHGANTACAFVVRARVRAGGTDEPQCVAYLAAAKHVNKQGPSTETFDRFVRDGSSLVVYIVFLGSFLFLALY